MNTIFDINSNIVEDWYGGYKLELDITAQENAEDWQLTFDLPYNISAVYGADLTSHGNGSYTIQGQNDQVNLQAGQWIQPIFIIEDHGQQALPLVISNLDYANKSTLANNSSDTTAKPTFSTQSHIVQDWYGGYKLELDITPQSDANNWEIDFKLPYNIREVYGVDLTNHGDGSYTIKGENNQVNLQAGQWIQPIFIIEDNNQQALPLEIINANSPNPIESTPDNESTDNSTVEQNLVAPAPSNGDVINVDHDFGGDLAAAIASAQDGQTVQLGNRAYYTSELTISKDITVTGQSGSVINGGGTSDSIVRLTPGASGATIQDITITNGNNGIYAYGASNLTLQNINVHNVGKNPTIASGENNTGITLNYVDGLQLIDTKVYDVGRKGVSVGDTDGAVISGLSVENVNLAAKHSQSHDAAGIKFFNTNDILLKDSHFVNINANYIWNDTTNKTRMENNFVERVGSVFLEPSFNDYVDISGIYNEKSSNSVVKYNYGSSVGNFAAYNATAFTTETMTVEDNNFSIIEINTTDYWVNESAEKLIALTEDPAEADFSLFSDEYLAQVIID